MSKENLNAFIRFLESKKAIADKYFKRQRLRELSGKPVRVSSSYWEKVSADYSEEIHKIKLEK